MSAKERKGTRSVAAIRRNGWDRTHVERALAALSAIMASPTNADGELARELVDWMAPDPERTLRVSAPKGLALIPPHLETVANILQDTQGEARITRLRATHADPTAVVIEILDDMEAEDLEDSRGPSSLAQHAIETLGQIGMVSGVRYLCTLLEGHAGRLHDVVRGAIGMVAGIVEATVELWSTSKTYARHVMIEAIASAKKQDDRVFALVARWLESADDLMAAALAASGYEDERVVPHLHRALERALEMRDVGAVQEIVDCLEQYGAEPMPDQRSRWPQLAPRA